MDASQVARIIEGIDHIAESCNMDPDMTIAALKAKGYGVRLSVAVLLVEVPDDNNGHVVAVIGDVSSLADSIMLHSAHHVVPCIPRPMGVRVAEGMIS